VRAPPRTAANLPAALRESSGVGGGAPGSCSGKLRSAAPASAITGWHRATGCGPGPLQRHPDAGGVPQQRERRLHALSEAGVAAL